MSDQANAKNPAQKLIGGAVFVIVLIVALWWGFSSEGKTKAQALEEAKAMLAGAVGYDSERAYYDEILAAAHEKSFALSYTSGRRPWRSSFDKDLYFAELFQAMRERAKADGKSAVYDALVKLQEQRRGP